MVLVMLGSFPCFAATALVLHFTDSTEIVCVLAKQPQMQFSQNAITLTSVDGMVGQWDFADVESWHFADVSATHDIEADQVMIRMEGDKITVSGLKTQNVALYDVSGRLISTSLDAIDDTVGISLNGFTTGIYLLKVGDKCLKFMVR